MGAWIRRNGKRIYQVFDDISRLRVSLYAGNASFFVLLAVFPALMLVMSVIRYTGLDINMLTDMLDGFIPSALMSGAKRIILNTYYSTSTAVVSISAVTALWAASRGVYGILRGLNGVYGVEEDRGYFYTRLISVVYTFGFLIVLLLTLVLHVFSNQLLEFLSWKDGALFSFLMDVVNLRFFVLLGIQTVLFTAIYVVLPNKRNRIRDSLPGAMLASAGWLIYTDLYSIYVKYFTGSANLYGPVYTVALSMLWLYFCLSILFYGGALNAYLTAQEKREK